MARIDVQHIDRIGYFVLFRPTFGKVYYFSKQRCDGSISCGNNAPSSSRRWRELMHAMTNRISLLLPWGQLLTKLAISKKERSPIGDRSIDRLIGICGSTTPSSFRRCVANDLAAEACRFDYSPRTHVGYPVCPINPRHIG